MSEPTYNRVDETLDKNTYRQMIIDAATSAGINPRRIFTLPAQHGHDVALFSRQWPKAKFTCIERAPEIAYLRDPHLRRANINFLVTHLNQFVCDGKIEHLVPGPQRAVDGSEDDHCAEREKCEIAPNNVRRLAFKPHDVAFLDYTGFLHPTAKRDCVNFALKFLADRFVLAVTFSIPRRPTARGLDGPATIARVEEMFDEIREVYGFQAPSLIDTYQDSDVKMVFGMLVKS